MLGPTFFLNVGNLVFLPVYWCHICCCIQVLSRCQSPGSYEIFQSPSSPIPQQLYVVNWYFVVFLCTSTSSWKRIASQPAATIYHRPQCYIEQNDRAKRLSRNNEVPKKHGKFRITIWDMIDFYNLKRSWVRSMHHSSWLLCPPRCKAPGFLAL